MLFVQLTSFFMVGVILAIFLYIRDYEQKNRQRSQQCMEAEELDEKNLPKSNKNKENPSLEENDKTKKDPCPEQPTLKQSKSATDWRKEGNEFYTKGSNANLPFFLQREYLNSAINCYKSALKNCSNENHEKSSNHKNLAVVYKRYAVALCLDSRKEEKAEDFFKSALQNYIFALSYSKEKDDNWIQSVNQSLDETVVAAMKDAVVKSPNHTSRASLLQSYLFEVNQHKIRKKILNELIFIEFEIGQEAFVKRQYNVCLQHMHECQRLLNDMLLLCEGKLDDELKLLQTDVELQMKLSQSIIHRLTGEEILRKLKHQNKPLTKIGCDAVFSHFRDALCFAKNSNVIEEATALSRLGHLYDLLGDKVYATSYIKKCQACVEPLLAQQYQDKDWYKDCLETLQRYKDSIVVHESDRWKTTRQQYLAEIEKEMKTLEEISKQGPVPFLYNLYVLYPPKIQNHVAPLKSHDEMVSIEQLRKIYRKARLHYSQDKVNVSEHGEKWKVFCEQISTMLNTNADLLNTYADI